MKKNNPAEKNISADNNKNSNEKKISVSTVLVLVLLAAALLLLLVFFCETGGDKPAKTTPADTLAAAIDTLSTVDTVITGVDTVDVDTVVSDTASAVWQQPARVDTSVRREKIRADSLARADSIARAHADSLARAHADSLARVLADSLNRADSLAAAISADPCVRDTIMPWVYADPSGGLHRKAVAVKLAANKECRIEWSFDGIGGWKIYDGKPISISSAATLYYRAEDKCGKKMEVRSKRYEFDLKDISSKCPPDMEYVKAGGKEFCVDIYEWPNRKGEIPNSYVSLYQAMDSCFSVRKRLCASDEWTAACAGPENWRYLYGEIYEPYTCVATDSTARRSGSRPECRGYYGVFDMSGNLAEWTSTSSPQDRSFNNVMGGFWISGSQTRCTDARYSYFPQNRHNPVGFRCCRDAGPLGGETNQRGRGR